MIEFVRWDTHDITRDPTRVCCYNHIVPTVNSRYQRKSTEVRNEILALNI
jgi:hypothetical protein